MGLFSKIRKGVKKTVKSTWSATAPILTGTLVKPEKLGIKSKDQQKIFDTVTKGTRVVAGGTAAAFTLGGAPVALGGAGMGSGGFLGTAGGPMAFLSGIFGKTTPAVPLSQSGMPTGAPHEPTSTFGSSYNQRLETLGQVDPTGGFGGQIPVTAGGILQNKIVLFGLGIAVLLAGILVFRRK